MAGPRIEILDDRCVGCALCAKACPFGAISICDGKAAIDYDACTLCGACVPICRKFGAIRMTGERQVVERSVQGDVWVFCECDGTVGELASVSIELLGRARELADELGVDVSAVLIGSDIARHARSAIRHGADRAFVAEHDRLRHFDDERYSAILARLVRRHRPEILLGGATTVGRALLPRVAVMVHTGLTADCTELSIDRETGLLRQTRPAFGGNILATIVCENHRPQMATVRPGVLRCPDPDPARAGETITCMVRAEELSSCVEFVRATVRGGNDVGLREAEVIVSAGYGVGGADGMVLISDLAVALGGAVGASRSVVDAGWLGYSHQVGQTGTTVQPKLYMACGISGAIQHIVGMQNAETVVAINRDPEAPIFDYADYAIVGDLFEIVPEVLRQLRG